MIADGVAPERCAQGGSRSRWGELCLSAFIFGPVMTNPRDFFGVAFAGMGCSEENAGEYWRDIAAQCTAMLEAPVQLMVLYPHLIFEKNGWPTPMWGRSVSWTLIQSCGLNPFSYKVCAGGGRVDRDRGYRQGDRRREIQ